MPGLTLVQVTALLDSIAKQAVNIRELGFDVNAVGYDNNRATILAAQNQDDLSAGVDLAAAFSSDILPAFGSSFETRRRSIDKHVKGLSAYLITNDTRGHYALRDYLGWAMSAETFFPPVHSNIATFTFTAADAGTFAAGVGIDITKYGKAWLEVEVITQPTAGASVLTVVGTKRDGTPQSKVVDVPLASAVGTKIPIGTKGLDADNFGSVTGITATGGAAADAVKIISVLERTIAL